MGRKGFLRYVRDLISRNSVDLSTVLDPHISGSKVDGVVNRIGYNKHVKVNAVGFFFGIWVLWNGEALDVEIIFTSFQFVNLLVYTRFVPWLLTVVYANSKGRARELLWFALKDVGSICQLAWLVAGDFNEVSSRLKKTGGMMLNVLIFRGVNG